MKSSELFKNNFKFEMNKCCYLNNICSFSNGFVIEYVVEAI